MAAFCSCVWATKPEWILQTHCSVWATTPGFLSSTCCRVSQLCLSYQTWGIFKDTLQHFSARWLSHQTWVIFFLPKPSLGMFYQHIGAFPSGSWVNKLGRFFLPAHCGGSQWRLSHKTWVCFFFFYRQQTWVCFANTLECFLAAFEPPNLCVFYQHTAAVLSGVWATKLGCILPTHPCISSSFSANKCGCFKPQQP